MFWIGLFAGLVIASVFWLALDNWLAIPRRKAKARLTEVHNRMHGILVQP